jgi:hypothetical protein
MSIFYYRFGIVILMWISHVSLSNCPSCQLLYTFGVHSLSWFHFLYPSLCEKGGQWLVTGLWLSPVYSTNWSDFHDMTDILLKVVFNTITLTHIYYYQTLRYSAFMLLNCMCLTTQGQTINTMLFIFLVKNVEPSEQS